MGSHRASRSYLGTAARRRGVTIAAAAVTASLLGQGILPVQLPVAAATEVTQRDNRGSLADHPIIESDNRIEYIGLTDITEQLPQPGDGADAMLRYQYWYKLNPLTIGGQTYRQNRDFPDSGKIFLRFRDAVLAEQIVAIKAFNANGTVRGEFAPSQNELGEWSAPIGDVTATGNIGSENYNDLRIYLKDGVELSQLTPTDDGFYVDTWAVRGDNQVSARTMTTAVINAVVPQNRSEEDEEVASIQNFFKTAGRNRVRIDQDNNVINQTITFTPDQNFLQTSYSWSAVLNAQIDPSLVPYIDEVVVFHSDFDGKTTNGPEFKLSVDENGYVTSRNNREISWLAPDSGEFNSDRFSEVRLNQDRIFFGTLGQPRSFNIQYRLKPSAAQDIEKTMVRGLAEASEQGQFLEFIFWMESDLIDYPVLGSGSVYDNGAEPALINRSYVPTYLNVEDIDADGLTNEYERTIGTDPYNNDTDGDGVPDGVEVLLDKTNPLDSKSYSPGEPVTDATVVATTKIDTITGTAPKPQHADSLIPGADLEVLNNGPAPTQVYLVPTSAVSTGADGRPRADVSKAIASDTFTTLDQVMPGEFELSPTSVTATPGEYVLVSVSPNGEVTTGSTIMVTTPQTNDFDLTIAGKDAVALESVTSDPAAFTNKGVAADAPQGVTYTLQPKDGYTIVTDGVADEPSEVSIAADGAVTFVPRLEDADTTVTFDVRALYEDRSEDNVQVSFPVAQPRDTDGDQIPDYQDPDQGGEMTDGRTLTVGVTVDGAIIKSNGDNADNGAELPESLRGLTVTVGDVASGTAATWRGTKDYPVVQNFGLNKFDIGAHTVAISGADAWKDSFVLLPSGINSSDSVTLSGTTGTQYVNFETKQTTTYSTPDAPLAKATTSTPTFGNATTDSRAKNSGTTFELGTLPAGYTATTDGAAPTAPGQVSINPATGAVTFIPLVADISKDVTIPVTTNFVDGTTATSNAVFNVGDGQTAGIDPSYADTDATPTKPATATMSLKEGQSLPAGTKFAGTLDGYEQVASNPQPGQFTIDAQGNVTLVPKLADATKDLTVAVVATYPDGSADTANATFKVGADLAGLIDPSYDSKDTNPTRRATSDLKLGADQSLPAGTTMTGEVTGAKGTYTKAATLADVVPGTYYVSSTGAVTINPLLEDANNKDLAVAVTFAYPDGSKETATAAFPVGQTLSQKHTAAYGDSSGVAYEKTTIAAPAITPDYAFAVTYKAGAVPDGYDAVASVAEVTAPGDYYVAPNGVITVIPLTGSPVELPVTATFADQSTQDIVAKLTVTSQADKYTPTYGTVVIPPNGVKSSPVGGDLPDGSAFEATMDGYNAVNSKDAVTPGTFFINPDTGELTVGAKADQPEGHMTAMVTVTYPDGSQDTGVQAVFDVEKNLAAQNSVDYTDAYVAPTAKVTSTPTLNDGNPGPSFAATAVAGATKSYTAASSADAVEAGQFFVDPATGAVTIVPRLEDANKELTVSVTATYSDTSTDVRDAVFNVGPTIAEGIDATYPKTDAKPSAPATAKLDTNGKGLPAETEFSGKLTGGAQDYAQVTGPATQPGTFSIGTDGTVTVVPRLEDADRDLTVAVAITYSDGSADSANAVFGVGSAITDSYDPQYTDVTGTPGIRADIDAPTGLPETGATLTAETPTDYTLKDSAIEVTAPGDFYFDTTTGAIALVPPLTAANTIVTVPVTVTYSDGSIDKMSPKVTVGNQAQAYAPAYTGVEALPGVEAKIAAPAADPAMPTGTSYALATTGLPAGYTADNVKVAADGSITVTPPADASAGVVPIPVVVTYPDKSAETIYATVDVKPLNGSVDFTVEGSSAQPGLPATSDKAEFTKQGGNDAATKPAGTTFSGELDGYVAVASADDVDAPGEFFVDPATGAVTIAPKLADANSEVTVTVTATYTDGTTDTANAVFTVGETQENTYDPAYGGANATVNSPASQKQTATDLPDGTKFTGNLPGYAVAQDPSDVKPGEFYVDPATGEVTVNPKLTDANKDLTVAVTATYPDTSRETVDAKFSVAQTLAATHKGTYKLTNGVVAEMVTVAAPTFDAALPEGVTPTFTAGTLTGYTAVDSAEAVAKQGDFFINADGSIVVIPLAAGSVNIPVTVAFSDGSRAQLTAPLNVISQANAYGPYYSQEEVAPNAVAKSTVKTTKTLPAGTNFAAATGDAGAVNGGSSEYTAAADPANLQPGEYAIDADTGEVSIRPTLADENKTLTVNVVVTYPDNSKDPVQAPFTVGATQATQYEATYTEQAATPAAVATSTPAWDGTAPTDAKFSGELAGYDKADSADDLQPGEYYVDPATGVVSVNPKLEDAEGQLSVAVTVTYSDGSTDTVTADFTVGKTQAATHDPAYKPATALPGQEISIDAPTSDPAVPADTKFEVGPDAPADYKITIADDGALTVTPPVDAQAGEVTIPVTVTYPDGSKETINATVTVTPLNGSTDFSIGGKDAQPGFPVTSDAAVFTGTKPTGTTFAGALDGYVSADSKDAVKPGQFFVDPTTGAVTIVPKLEDAEKQLTVVVTATYTDKTTDRADALFSVGKTQATTTPPAYGGAQTAPTAPVTQEQTADVPEGTKFTGALDGYDAAASADDVKPGQYFIDPTTGDVTVNPKLDDANGELTVKVTAEYPDGSKADVDATFTVNDSQAGTYAPAYQPATGIVAEPLTIDAPTFTPELADGVTAKFAADTAPAGYTLKDSADAVTAKGDYFVADDGTITVIPAAEGEANIPVKVTYTDGSTETAEAKLTAKTQADSYSPSYDAAEVAPNTAVTSNVVANPALPEGTTFAGTLDGYDAAASVDLKAGQFFVNEDTGAVTVKPRLEDLNKALNVAVTVTYPDGTTDSATAQFNVGNTQAGLHDATYSTVTGAPVSILTSTPTLTDGFPGATFTGALDGYEAATSADVQPGQFYVDPSTGVVSVNPKLVDANKSLSVTVTVAYGDGSSEDKTATFTVGKTIAEGADPAYTLVESLPGTAATIAAPFAPNTAPAGTKFTATAPEGYTLVDSASKPGEVSIDGSGAVTIVPRLADKSKQIDVPVVVTYTDGSTDELKASTKVGQLADTVAPTYPAATVKQEGTVTVDIALPDDQQWPAGERTFATSTAGVTVNEDGTLTVKAPEGASVGDEVTGTVTVTFADGSTKNVPFKVTVAIKDNVPSTLDDISSQTIVEGNPITAVTPAATGDNPTVSVSGLPDGLTFVDGVISGTPTVADWGADEERKFTVTVTVKDDRDEDLVKTFDITVQRDTDKDGVPDVTDTDDDGDGFSDEQEKAAGSDPKDANSIPAMPLTPATGIESVDNQTVVEHKPIETITVTPVNDDATVEVTVPEGLTYNEETGDITGTPDVSWDGDQETQDVEVTVVVTNPDGSKVTETITITVQRDTDKDGEPDLTDTDDDGDGVSDADELAGGSDPKDPNSRPWMPLTPATGIESVEDQTVVEHKPIETITVTPVNDDATVEVTVPEGLSYNEETGEVTGTPVVEWDGDQETQDVEVKIVVTNPDGSKVTETITITVQRDTDKDGEPDLTDTDDDGDGYTDEQEKAAGSDPKDANSIPWTPLTPATGIESVDDQTIIEGNDITPIKVDPVNDEATVEVTVPEGLSYNEENGEVTGTPVVEWDGEQETQDVEVKVVVTNPDGSKVSETITITVQRDTDGDGEPDVTDTDDDGDGIPDTEDATPKDYTNPQFAETVSTKPDTTLTIENTGGAPKPGTTVESSDPDFVVTIDPNTGDISVIIPEDAADGDTVTITVKDEDGKVIDTIGVTVSESAISAIEDVTVVEGKPIEDIVVTSEDENAKFTVDPESLPDGITFDSSTGTFSGTPELDDWGSDEETRDFTIVVTAENSNGSVVTEEFTITVQRDTDRDGEPDVTDLDDDGDGVSDVDEIAGGSDPKDPNSRPWMPLTPATGIESVDDQTVVEHTPIETITVTPKNPDAAVEVTVPEGLTFDEETGEISGTPTVEWDGDQETQDVEIKVVVTNPDGSKVSETITITVQRDTDRDGDPDVTDLDDDGDGVSDVDEIAGGSDPKDPNSRPWMPLTPATGIESVDDQTVIEHKDITPITVVPVNDDATVEVTVPEGLTYNDETGEITGTPVVEWDGDQETQDVEVKIVVTNPDGSKVTETITITVQRDTDRDGEPDVTDSDDDGDGFTDEQEKAAGADPKDPNSFPVEPSAPATGINPVHGQTVIEFQPIETITVVPVNGEATVEVTVPEGLTFDEETGEITGTPVVEWDGDQETQDVEVTVVVTNPDGSKVTETITITVQRDTDRDGDPDVTDPDDDGDGFTDEQEKAAGTDPKDPNSFPATPLTPATGIESVQDQTILDGEQITPIVITTIDPDASVDIALPEGLKLTEDGQIVGSPVAEWADGQDSQDVKVTVVVTNSDGSKVTEEIAISIIRRAADLYDPAYGITDVPAGEKVATGNPFGDKAPSLREVNVGERDMWTFTGEDTGVVTAGAPIFDDLAKKYADLFGGKGASFDQVVEGMRDFTNPVVDVEIAYADESADTATAEFRIVGKDGKPLSDPDADFDGDGASNKAEIEAGTNPFDDESQPTDTSGVEDSSSSDALKRCFADPSTAWKNPLYWLIPAGILVSTPLPAGIQAQLDGAAGRINNQVNQLAGQLGLEGLLPRFDIPPALNINTYLTHDQQRQLLGAAMVIAGIAATAAYFNSCLNVDGGSSSAS